MPLLVVLYRLLVSLQCTTEAHVYAFGLFQIILSLSRIALCVALALRQVGLALLLGSVALPF